MCANCNNAVQSFGEGAIPRDRPLQTSVEQGTSPDWGGNRQGGGGSNGFDVQRWIDDGDVIDEARGDYGQYED